MRIRKDDITTIEHSQGVTVWIINSEIIWHKNYIGYNTPQAIKLAKAECLKEIVEHKQFINR